MRDSKRSGNSSLRSKLRGIKPAVIERPTARMLEAVLRIPVAMGKSDIPFGSVDRSKAVS